MYFSAPTVSFPCCNHRPNDRNEERRAAATNDTLGRFGTGDGNEHLSALSSVYANQLDNDFNMMPTFGYTATGSDSTKRNELSGAVVVEGTGRFGTPGCFGTPFHFGTTNGNKADMTASAPLYNQLNNGFNSMPFGYTATGLGAPVIDSPVIAEHTLSALLAKQKGSLLVDEVDSDTLRSKQRLSVLPEIATRQSSPLSSPSSSPSSNTLPRRNGGAWHHHHWTAPLLLPPCPHHKPSQLLCPITQQA